MYEFEAHAIEVLSGLDVPEQWHSGPQVQQGLTAPGLRSLYAFLDTMPDFRRPRGQRYSLSCYLAIMVAARLAGYREVTALGEFATRLSSNSFKLWERSGVPTASAIPRQRLPLSTASCRHWRPIPWTKRCASGPPSTAPKGRPSHSTGKSCVAPRSRSRAKGG